MKKKILAGLLSAMMVVSLAACGSSETGATATESKSETTANTADEKQPLQQMHRAVMKGKK